MARLLLKSGSSLEVRNHGSTDKWQLVFSSVHLLTYHRLIREGVFRHQFEGMATVEADHSVSSRE